MIINDRGKMTRYQVFKNLEAFSKPGACVIHNADKDLVVAKCEKIGFPEIDLVCVTDWPTGKPYYMATWVKREKKLIVPSMGVPNEDQEKKVP